MIEQNSDILTDKQKELICQYFITHCTSKRDTKWGISEQKIFEEQFAELIPDWEKRMGHSDFAEIRNVLKGFQNRNIS